VLLAVIVGGLLIHGTNRDSYKSKVTGKSKYSFPGKKSQYVSGYATAPASLQQTLVNQYYNQAKANCISANESVSQNVQANNVMTVAKVAGSNALIQFCGSGGDAIFNNTSGSWKIIGTDADAPDCSLVSQYKISKQIVPQCYEDATKSLTDVTNP
jgi:hypothetical protein